MRSPARWFRDRSARRRWVADALVTTALRERPGMSGFPQASRTGLPSGTVYATLERLRAAGRVVGEWEAGSVPGTPRRRFYRLTEDGRDA